MTTHEEITEELMQQILREVKNDTTILVIPGLEVKELVDDNHMGSCLNRVTVKYTHQDDTSQHSMSLLVKAMPQNSPIADIVQQSTLFVREIQMFNMILPRMSNLLSRTLPDSHTDFSARGYYTRKTPSYLIAIEDLSPKGFKDPNFKNGLDLEHCLLGMKTIARFHAASVMIRREDESLLAVFDKYAFQEEGANEGLVKIHSKIILAVAKEMETSPEFGRSWADRLRQRSKTLQEDLRLLMKRNEGAFNVLNHGDFALHNVMYRYSETSGEVEEIMLVDFQCCSYNSPVLDLHQFIFGSANDDVRVNHVDKLLREYHSELTSTLEALGYPQEQIISMSQLLDDFNNKLLYGFLYTLLELMFMSIHSGNSPGIATSDIFDLSDDGDKLKQIVTDLYLSRLRTFLPIFTNNKIL